MNEIFNLRRFGLLLRKTFLEKPVQMMGFIGLILALTLITYAITKTLIWYNAAQNLTFIWGLPVGGGFLACFVFNSFASPSNGSSYLTLPASAFEKWLCTLVISSLFFLAIFLGFFRLMDASFVSLYHRGLDPENPFYKQRYESVYIFPFDGVIASKVYPAFFVLSGAMALGALYFNKLSFIKTAILLCIISFACFGLNWLFADLLFGHILEAAPFHHVTIPVGKEEGNIDLSESMKKIVGFSLGLALPVALWLLTYLRLREKEF